MWTWNQSNMHNCSINLRFRSYWLATESGATRFRSHYYILLSFFRKWLPPPNPFEHNIGIHHVVRKTRAMTNDLQPTRDCILWHNPLVRLKGSKRMIWPTNRKLNYNPKQYDTDSYSKATKKKIKWWKEPPNIEKPVGTCRNHAVSPNKNMVWNASSNRSGLCPFPGAILLVLQSPVF